MKADVTTGGKDAGEKSGQRNAWVEGRKEFWVRTLAEGSRVGFAPVLLFHGDRVGASSSPSSSNEGRLQACGCSMLQYGCAMLRYEKLRYFRGTHARYNVA